MKRLLLYISLLLSLAATAQKIQPKPVPPRLVNDFAGILTPDQKETLERKLVTYNDSTSTQIAIIIVSTTGDYDIQEVALKYLREWGVGTAKKDNGVVLLAAIDDRKIRIETGYGMEGVLPDVLAKRIIENEIVPNFKKGNYYRGFDEATTAIIKAAAGEYKAEKKKQSKKIPGGSITFIILAVIIVLLLSAGGGGMIGPMLLGSLMSGRSSGGGWGSSSGGFGGFGGGSGGGGGASGSW